MFADLGNGKFDGAHLVAGFEDLNPANTLWRKQYNLYSRVDNEEQRYLDFEKWWGGFFFTTKEEIHFITESLFIGNKLEQGKLALNNAKVDLKNIHDPVIVFASHGDNITAPQQALNWIARTWQSDENIVNQGKIIIYLVHKNIGHLGIFVSGKIANKEHKELFKNMDVFEYLAPGLYEMVVDDQNSPDTLPDIQFQSRKLKDIADLNDPVGEKEFEIVNMVSRINESFYSAYLSPFITTLTTEYSAAFLRQFHPLRVERNLISDLNPAMVPVKTISSFIRNNRKPVSENNPFLHIERTLSNSIGILLDFYRDQRDSTNALLFYSLYGNPLFVSLFELLKLTTDSGEMASNAPERTSDRDDEEKEHGEDFFQKGDFVDGIARILMLISGNDDVVKHNELKTIKNIISFHESMKNISKAELVEKLKKQSAIVHKDKNKALDGLAEIFKTPSDCKLALEVAHHIAVADNDELSREDITMIDRLSEILKKVDVTNLNSTCLN